MSVIEGRVGFKKQESGCLVNVDMYIPQDI